jgi:Outer membrane receptor proteins, mostly Fe transport
MKKCGFLHSLLLFLLTGEVFYAYAQTGEVKGTVHGKESILQVATVSLGKSSVLTDKNGEFMLHASPGNYSLIISHSGYKNDTREIKIVAGYSQSFNITLTPVDQMGEVVVLGSRSFKQRTNLNTPVPVDLFLSDQLAKTGQPTLTQMLNFVAPSFNASRQLINEPVTLKGLYPDQVLILINGIRYHNMAYLNDEKIRGILGRGSVANDLNSIPFSAIEKVEIMRDGAAAQYGSDAIAGVINIHLKRSTGKTFVQLNTGQFYKGDGETINFGINHGIELNKKGFISLSSEFNYRNPTNRGGEYKGNVYLNSPSADDSIIEARNFNRKNVSNAGITKLISLGFSANGGYHIKNKTELFGTFLFNGRNNIFTGAYGFPKFIRRVNPEIFPDGFKPRSKQDVVDITGIAGIKGETNNRWSWEYSSSYGSNNGRYHAENTNNASQYYTLGKNAPTSFYTGSLVFQQFTNNISLAKDLLNKTGWIKLFNIAWGAEWRMENYQIKAGEEAAWENYDSLQRRQGASQNGMIFRPENVINKNRNVFGTYIDVESEFTDKLLVDVASRYEYYSDFGGNIAGKIAARYKISNQFSLRGSLSKGFRAPALQQRYFSTTSRGFVIAGAVVTPVTSGIFRNNSDIASAFGIPSLQPEKSQSLNGGFTATLFKDISLTVDAYWIQIRNHLVLSGRFDKSNPDVKRILDSLPGFDQVQFFTNAINTRTHGVDVVLNGNWNITKGSIGLTLGANYNRNHIYGKILTSAKLPDSNVQNANTLFNIEERTKLEKGQPDSKIILSLNITKGKLQFIFRNTRFGKTATTTIVTNPTDTLYEYFSAKILTDIGINYSPKHWLIISGGVNNIFNVYPDRLKNYINTAEGTNIYGNEASPFGFNGGYYYIKMDFKF